MIWFMVAFQLAGALIGFALFGERGNPFFWILMLAALPGLAFTAGFAHGKQAARAAIDAALTGKPAD